MKNKMLLRIGPHSLKRFRERFPANMGNLEIIEKLNNEVADGIIAQGTKKEPKKLFFPACSLYVVVMKSTNTDGFFIVTVYQGVFRQHPRQKKASEINVRWLIGKDEE